ncbi:hypothetical protein [Armatimonas sp.]|uniref:hypothetical protein n=1 Tax=Armatimonas sp. TaxID=1872638 RepID=UPI00286B2907|nr:hypothetical protein [Armatimonas sp.]
MARRDAQAADAQAAKVLQVDEARGASDDFKLSEKLQALLSSRLEALRTAERAVNASESDRVGSKGAVTEALKALRERLKDGYNHIKAVPGFQIMSEQRRAAFEDYGWEGGMLGSLARPERVLSLARQVAAATPSVTPTEAQYPQALRQHIATELARYDANSLMASVGGRRGATVLRNKALQELEHALDRVRFSYCAASDERDATSELAKIDFQPIRRSAQRRLKTEGTG